MRKQCSNIANIRARPITMFMLVPQRGFRRRSENVCVPRLPQRSTWYVVRVLVAYVIKDVPLSAMTSRLRLRVQCCTCFAVRILSLRRSGHAPQVGIQCM